MKKMLVVSIVAATIAGGVLLAQPWEPEDTRACIQPSRRAVESDAPLPFARTGRMLVANTFAGSATIIDLATGQRETLDTGTDPHDAAVSPDGRWGVVSNYGPDRGRTYLGNKLYVIDMERRRVARVIETGEYRGLHDVAFRPGHPTRVLVTAQTSQRLIEVDIVTGRVVGATDTEGVRSHMVAVTSDGNVAFTTNEGSGTISRLDLTTGRLAGTFPATEHVEGVAVAAGDAEIWVGESGLGAVTVRDAETGAVLQSFAGFRYPNRVAGSPDGKRVVISDPGCRVIVVADAETRRIVSVTEMLLDPPVLVGEVSPDGRIGFASVNDDRLAITIDLDEGRILRRYRAGWGADGVGWGGR